MPETKVARGKKRGCGMTSGMCCIRTTLVTFNLGTGLAGVCMIAIGVMLYLSSCREDMSGVELLDQITETDEIPNNGEFRAFGILCMILGGLIGFISFVGCFGACVNSRCLLLIYLFSVVIAVILQLFVSVFAIIYRQPVSNTIRGGLLDTLHLDTNFTQVTWDKFQVKFGCCGVDGFSDWFRGDEQVVPDSCCLDIQPGCGTVLDPSRWQRKGCLAQIQLYVLEILHLIAFAIVGVVFLQLYGIIASTLLFYHIRSHKPPNTFKAYRYERAKM